MYVMPQRLPSLPFPRPTVFKAQQIGCFLGSWEEEEEEEGCVGQDRRCGTAGTVQEGWARQTRARMEQGGGGLQKHGRHWRARRAGKEQDTEAKK